MKLRSQFKDGPWHRVVKVRGVTAATKFWRRKTAFVFAGIISQLVHHDGDYCTVYRRGFRYVIGKNSSDITFFRILSDRDMRKICMNYGLSTMMELNEYGGEVKDIADMLTIDS